MRVTSTGRTGGVCCMTPRCRHLGDLRRAGDVLVFCERCGINPYVFRP